MLVGDRGTSPFVAAATGADEPVISRIESMISAFFVRLFAFRPSALAIAKSWSLSFDSRTDCSSASAATRVTSLHGSGRCPDFHGLGVAQTFVFAVVGGGVELRCPMCGFGMPRRHRPTVEERTSLVRHPPPIARHGGRGEATEGMERVLPGIPGRTSRYPAPTPIANHSLTSVSFLRPGPRGPQILSSWCTRAPLEARSG